MTASLVTAWCTGLAGVIAAVGVVLKIVLTRPRLPVAEEVLERLAELEEQLLLYATWAHTVRMVAAASGIELPTVPLDLAERRSPHRMAPRLIDRGATDTNPRLPMQTGARHRG